MNKLKPCPFCGSEARLFPHSHIENLVDNVGLWAVICQNAKCNARILFCQTQEEAIQQWNQWNRRNRRKK